MKQSLLLIALIAVLLFSSSALNESPFGVMPGDRAPELTLGEGRDSVSTSDYRGKYLLVSFWSSEDATSRMRCNGYSKWLASQGGEQEIAMIAVNFDENETLFNQIVAADGMNDEAQFNVTGEEARKIRNEFKLNDGLGTLLIDPDGIVVAANPDSQALRRISGRHT